MEAQDQTEYRLCLQVSGPTIRGNFWEGVASIVKDKRLKEKDFSTNFVFSKGRCFYCNYKAFSS